MRIRRVYIKKAGGEIASEACYTAWRGFSHLGYPLDFFEWEDLAQNCLRLDRRTLVVGGTTVVHRALRQIGVEIPKPLNLPEPLRSFAGRRVWETTLGAMRDAINAGGEAVFVKPLFETKAFPGGVVRGRADLDSLAHLDGDLRLQASEPVEFVSECRYYLHRGSIVGMAHYKGDWSQFADGSVVRAAVACWASAPSACSLDFGLTADGRTLLVEANDAFALGAHGIDAVAYARMLEDRWLEITGGEDSA